jgi:oxepin-CoA hydrolase/3-oxo-5,6-dehydrosuberyl-CoA semialdehyde dehydrogenase
MAETKTEARPLAHYVAGRWVAPERGAPIWDPSTGQVVARFGDGGRWVGEAVEHARAVGRESLGALTFHQRALLLKALAQYLMANKEELHQVSLTTGATRRDSVSDIEGGIGVLFTLSSKARRELPNAHVIVDGPPEVLSKDGSFQGQHVYVRRPGVMFCVNAFNFPVWGMLEKLAPAFLAGLPVIVKPAREGAQLTAACVRLMVRSELLPPGSLQLICGDTRQFWTDLQGGDVVAFTGSAATASLFRRSASRIPGGIALTCETDSLNAAILGPDAVPGTPEFAAFIKCVATEIITKAGQKCTAVRRIVVPNPARTPVIEALAEALDKRAVIGDPRAEGVTVGPLASGAQRRAVAHAVEALVAGGGEIVYGGIAEPHTLRADGSVEPGHPATAFFQPTLLSFEDPAASALSTIEPFGPVASVVGYADVAQAVDIANAGLGSLVATVASADPMIVAQITAGIAGHHGRVHVLDGSTARSTTGHGSPVPHLVHGGPGRAGGSEELGGLRSVHHLMHRVAIQGSPDVLTALTGEWRPGAAARGVGRPEEDQTTWRPEDATVHPFRKSLADLQLGDSITSAWRQVTLDDIGHFADFTGDTFYAHTDEEAAAANPFFPGRVAHGYLLISWAAGLFVDPDPGPVLANYGLENLRFITPVSPGDSIQVQLTCKNIRPRETEPYGEVTWATTIRNQDQAVVANYDVLTLVAKAEPNKGAARP